jgi:hypothetical protein
MNERFAVDPEAIRGSADLRFVLGLFGPRSGRYISTLPKAWIEQVREATKSWPPVEAARASRLLALALDERRVLREKLSTAWSSERQWLENVRPLLMTRPARLEAAVIGDDVHVPQGLSHTVRIGDLSLPPTADERIDGTVEEYRRVCSVLLEVSQEVFMVDPYCDPTRQDHADVLSALWRDACDGPCKSIALWVLTSKVLSGARPKLIEALEEALQRLAPRGVKRLPQLTMNLVDDSGCDESMHARYLLSIHGGIRLERGFQRYRRSKVDVSPVSRPELLNELLSMYKDGRNGYRIEHVIRLPGR